MSLHTTSVISRRALDHPDEKPPVPATPLAYEHVLKYNPNHGSDGRFTSGGGGKAGGTAGAPTHGAYGQKLKPGISKGYAGSRFDMPSPHGPGTVTGVARPGTAPLERTNLPFRTGGPPAAHTGSPFGPGTQALGGVGRVNLSPQDIGIGVNGPYKPALNPAAASLRRART